MIRAIAAKSRAMVALLHGLRGQQGRFLSLASLLFGASLLAVGPAALSEAPDEAPNEASVLRYLETHPDFLDRYPELPARAAEMRALRARAKSNNGP